MAESPPSADVGGSMSYRRFSPSAGYQLRKPPLSVGWLTWLWMTLIDSCLTCTFTLQSMTFFLHFFCKVIDIHQLTLTDSWLNPDFTWLLVVFFDFSRLQYDYWLTFFFTEDYVQHWSQGRDRRCIEDRLNGEWYVLWRGTPFWKNTGREAPCRGGTDWS